MPFRVRPSYPFRILFRTQVTPAAPVLVVSDESPGHPPVTWVTPREVPVPPAWVPPGSAWKSSTWGPSAWVV